jgi:hypothetical protein
MRRLGDPINARGHPIVFVLLLSSRYHPLVRALPPLQCANFQNFEGFYFPCLLSNVIAHRDSQDRGHENLSCPLLYGSLVHGPAGQVVPYGFLVRLSTGQFSPNVFFFIQGVPPVVLDLD